MVIFHSYVSLPEGNWSIQKLEIDYWVYHINTSGIESQETPRAPKNW